MTSTIITEYGNQKDELIYLTKHKTEIINYQERKDAEKTISSGRMERLLSDVDRKIMV